jgi:hypothetical protein
MPQLGLISLQSFEGLLSKENQRLSDLKRSSTSVALVDDAVLPREVGKHSAVHGLEITWIMEISIKLYHYVLMMMMMTILLTFFCIEFKRNLVLINA